MLARSGATGLMVFANKIECERHQLERPRPAQHHLPRLSLPLAFEAALSQSVTQRPSWTLESMLARSGMTGLIVLLTKLSVNRILERPRPRALLALMRTTGISHRRNQTNCARTLPGRRCLKRWKQARNVPPAIQITSKLADHYTRITARLAQRHRQEQQQRDIA